MPPEKDYTIQQNEQEKWISFIPKDHPWLQSITIHETSQAGAVPRVSIDVKPDDLSSFNQSISKQELMDGSFFHRLPPSEHDKKVDELRTLIEQLQPKEKVPPQGEQLTNRELLSLIDDLLDGEGNGVVFYATPTSHVRQFLSQAGIPRGIEQAVMTQLQSIWNEKGL
ncbi:MAG: hypothetical protein LW823_06055 [Rickettsiales bacterium]|jgi:hypothetical protein|nr:hypothetical protein [Rickettsiales bacterium]